MSINLKPSKKLSLEEYEKLFGEIKYDDNDLKKEKEEIKDRFYLPVLNLNSPDCWTPKPLEKRKYFTSDVAIKTCLENCCGVEGLKSACCILDTVDLEHVLGPVDEKWIKKIIKYFKSKGFKNITRHDVVIDYEEGKIIGDTFFNGNKIFHERTSYPILRIQAVGPRFACKFLNYRTGKCIIYHIRPDMCKNYYCQYVKCNFLVATNDRPNVYKKLR